MITSGAATSFLDLMLYLIGLYDRQEAAILGAKAFLIEILAQGADMRFAILTVVFATQ